MIILIITRPETVSKPGIEKETETAVFYHQAAHSHKTVTTKYTAIYCTVNSTHNRSNPISEKQ